MTQRHTAINPDTDDEREPVDLHEVVAHWAQEAEEEELSDEEQLAACLESLNLAGHRRRSAMPVNAPDYIGRRTAARLRLSLPARFISLEGSHQAILLNVSRSGAHFAILKSVCEGKSGFLQCGKLNVFGIITRCDFNVNAIAFEEPLAERSVLGLRQYNEELDERERRRLIETARQWSSGENPDGHGI